MERTGPTAQSGGRVLLEGLVAGVLGYAVVALVFAVADLVSGRALFTTPAAIGGVLFYGVRDAASVVVSAGPVAAANGLHLLASLALGLAAALVFMETERHPQLFYLAFVLVVIFFVFTLLVLAVPSIVARAAPTAVVLLANMAGGLAVVGYLWLVHPALRSAADELAGADESDAGVQP
jgi:hypothetical protein